MLEDNPTGLERAEIEHAVGNEYQVTTGLKGFVGIERHHHGGLWREKQETQQPISTTKGNITPLRDAGARKIRSKNSEMPTITRRAK